jgi:transposase
MLTVYDYLGIRTAHAQGESIRSIALRLRHSQKTIRKVIASATGEPSRYARRKPAEHPKLGPFLTIIDQILKEDESAPPKQRHTAIQLHRRLVKENQYTGKYDQVRRYVNKHRVRERETFIPLAHDAGSRLECDFGQVWVDFPNGRRAISVLIVTWSFSHLPFMMALPTQRTEAILHGMVLALEFFGCVPREIWWDNPTTVATEILVGRARTLNRNYAALASHYRFQPLFCMPARGQEKSDVESAVRGLQKRYRTPVPVMADMAAFNAYLLERCREERERIVSGQTRSIAENFDLEKAGALLLPAHRFDPCIQRVGVVDKYQTVQLETNRYSVPRGVAFNPVTIKVYVDRVDVVQGDRILASHARSYGRNESILDPLHYLAALSRKPACLDHSGVFRSWKLPGVFADLRGTLEREHGARGGGRHYIRVLQLLMDHPVQRIAQAIEQCRGRQCLTAEIISAKARALAAGPAPLINSPSALAGADSAGDQAAPSILESDVVRRVTVPPVDLRRFDQLLNAGGPVPQSGEVIHVRTPDAAVAASPQDAEAADDVVGVCQAVA